MAYLSLSVFVICSEFFMPYPHLPRLFLLTPDFFFCMKGNISCKTPPLPSYPYQCWLLFLCLAKFSLSLGGMGRLW